MSFAALDSALLGPLFATAAMRETFADATLVRHMLAIEAALAEAQAAEGLAPSELAAAIRGVDAAALDLAAIGAATAVAGVPTIPFLKAIEAQLPEDLRGAFHRGATTQDILDTALALAVRDGLALLQTDAARTVAGLARLAAAHRTTPCVGRTYNQHAAPLTFGFKAAVWATGIADATAGLAARRPAASLGGPVGTLAALGPKGPAVAARFAAILGLAAEPVAAHVRRGAVAGLGAAVAILVGALAKLAADVAHLSSTEVGEVAEPHVPGRGGSSAMPHKRNPVGCTVILAAHAAAPGHVATLIAAMAALHERPAGPWHAEWHALPTLFGLASGALREAAAIAEGLEVDTVRMRRNLDATRGLLFTDAVAAALAPTRGRGPAHALVEHAAARVRDTGTPLAEVLAAMPDASGVDIAAAFSLDGAVAAAALWTDRALAALAKEP